MTEWNGAELNGINAWMNAWMERNGTELNERINDCMNEGTKDAIAQHDIISIQCEHQWTFSFLWVATFY